MSFKFPSEAWTKAYQDAVNANEGYRTHGKPWTFGAVAFVIKADPSLGIDAGLGFVSQGGTTTVDNGNQSTDTDDTGVTGFLLHAGVPLNLADDGHFSFQVVPELNVGFANATQSQGAGQPDIKLSGFGLDIGARAGA